MQWKHSLQCFDTNKNQLQNLRKNVKCKLLTQNFPKKQGKIWFFEQSVLFKIWLQINSTIVRKIFQTSYLFSRSDFFPLISRLRAVHSSFNLATDNFVKSVVVVDCCALVEAAFRFGGMFVWTLGLLYEIL